MLSHLFTMLLSTRMRGGSRSPNSGHAPSGSRSRQHLLSCRAAIALPSKLVFAASQESSLPLSCDRTRQHQRRCATIAMTHQDGETKYNVLPPGPTSDLSVALEAGEEETSLPSRESEGKEKRPCQDELTIATAVCPTNSTTTHSSNYHVDS